ncbi:GNAT family N-acetyltransferase [Acinetobacter indicus]|uniref:GNAT family N-acetyltransferase n=1 Tax=Acinetobacter indicus TaxID=756892 RepID=UPI0014444B22|nr:GNAT family N-acetyltransferase [Acinetobacter indicus]
MKIHLQTPRLILRQWQDSDAAPFIQMCADPEVMRYFLNPLTEQQSLAFMQRIQNFIATHGWGLFAVELKSSGEFIGFIGLHQHLEHYDFAPCIEIGWRLAKQYWHNGYATEGSKAVLDYAFRELQLDNVVSFTTVLNTPSEKVMHKIGLSKVKTFAHPLVPADHPLLMHVLYQIDRQSYLQTH